MLVRKFYVWTCQVEGTESLPSAILKVTTMDSNPGLISVKLMTVPPSVPPTATGDSCPLPTASATYRYSREAERVTIEFCTGFGEEFITPYLERCVNDPKLDLP